MQGLRAEHDVDIGHAVDNRLAFLACHTAADADQQIGVLQFEVPDSSQVMEYLLLRLFAHRAGIEQDDIGVFGRACFYDVLAHREHIGHLVRVVFVHLATEGADEQFLHHGESRDGEAGPRLYDVSRSA